MSTHEEIHHDTRCISYSCCQYCHYQRLEAREQFSDLNGHGATKEIMYLYDKHIIGGYPDGTFKPNQPITRAQAAAMLLKALDIKVIDKPTSEI